jgi:UDP-N-acetylenolpyruvoylglucosamine reductase
MKEATKDESSKKRGNEKQEKKRTHHQYRLNYFGSFFRSAYAFSNLVDFPDITDVKC